VKQQDLMAIRKPKMRLSSAIAYDLGASILSGSYRPGDLLEGEVAASVRLGVSRAVYREAMSILSAKGLLEKRPKAGTRVRPAEQWHWLDSDVLQWMFGVDDWTRPIVHLFELRSAIEPDVAYFSAERRTAGQLRDLQRALLKMNEGSRDSHEDAKSSWREFRAVLFDASNNLYLTALGHTIDQVMSIAVTNSPMCRLRRTDLKRYAEVVAAISDGSPTRARDAMIRLIDVERHAMSASRRE
jgi:DNA-binding FadR family transcriptional regulator